MKRYRNKQSGEFTNKQAEDEKPDDTTEETIAEFRLIRVFADKREMESPLKLGKDVSLYGDEVGIRVEKI